VKILKTDTGKQPEQRMVFAEVYAPLRPDCDQEFMTAEQIRKMAHDFARAGNFKQVDVNHNNKVVPGVEIVESFIARKGDPDFIEDSWVVGMHVNDDQTWADVKSGKINGFSMEALVEKEDREVEIEIPSVVTGDTSRDMEHVHKFFVRYNENGEFQGGTTDQGPDGHSHAIRAGTVTDTVSGHSHRFSSVDNLQLFEINDP